VTDFAEPVKHDGKSATFRRKLSISAESPVEGLYFRAGAGTSIEPTSDGGWVIDRALLIRVTGGGTAFVRESAGKKELLFPVTIANGSAEIVQDLAW
jgi:hypothetical protein